nr:hypothetical protein Iba_chr07fCG5260 [Ipomoea batatas]GME09657.1 hypothetical protein Iba_scaffold8947CG0270 [Ipomoea batatas]
MVAALLIGVPVIDVQNPELSAATMVMVTGIIRCDGDGDATATRLSAAKAMASSSLLRRQGFSAAVATSSLL